MKQSLACMQKTGCDTVSSFAGKGQLPAFQLVKENISFQEHFARFGISCEFSDVDFTQPQMFTCTLYGAKKSKSLMSTLTSTNCSAPNKQTLKGTNFLLVLTACTSTVSVPVTKQLFGKEHWMLSPKFLSPIEKGWLQDKGDAIALAIDWMEAYWLQMQYWN